MLFSIFLWNYCYSYYNSYFQNHLNIFTPGTFVINSDKKNEWGIGQIQSSINNLITVNFENVGKKTINLSKINLEIININATSWSIS